MDAVTGRKGPVSVNPDCLIVYLMALSCLLINCLLSPKKVLTAAVTSLCGMAERDARSETEDNGPAGLKAEDNGPAGIETEDKQAGKTLDGCT